jgi:hypothetical protein
MFSVYAQNEKIIEYPHRKVSVNCKPKEQCVIIRSRDEFYEFCDDGGRSKINFFREVLLSISVLVEFSAVKDVRYQVTQDQQTKCINFNVDFNGTPGRKGGQGVRLWIAIQKPIGNYEVKFFSNGNFCHHIMVN